MTHIAVTDGHEAHHQAGHPERPARLAAVLDAIGADPALSGLARLTGAAASREALERVHRPAYLDRLEAVCAQGGGALDGDTYATRASWDLARRACGNLIAIVDAVLDGDGTGFALGRPPGHHARPAQAMGFCLLSTAAVAARHARVARGVDRVLIVDLDVHHGNGTEEAFIDDPSVFVVSSHQAGIYPGTGAFAESGQGAGVGTTLNLPVPAGTGDELVDLYRRVLPVVAHVHQPDLVLVSFGADAHRLDPLAGLSMSVQGLADAVGVVQDIADTVCHGRLALTLEGGYHVDALAASVAAVLTRLLDPTASIVDPFGPTVQPGNDLSDLADAACARLAT